jgi:outer membrane lipoprotein LolB
VTRLANGCSHRGAWAPAALAALLGLVGCATPPAPERGPGFLSGRLALQVASSPPQSLNAGFELLGNAERGELKLLSTLGTVLAAARWAPGEVTLQTAEGTRQFDSLESLAREALGQALPLAALPDWLAGRPWMGAPHQPTAEGFEQAGWRVQTSQHAEGRIQAWRLSPPDTTLRVRLDPAP